MNPSAVPPKQPDRRKIPSDGFLFLNPSESRTGAGVRYGSDCRKTLLEKSLAELSRPQTTEGKEAPSFPATRASEMTPLMTDRATFLPESSPVRHASLCRKRPEAFFDKLKGTSLRMSLCFGFRSRWPPRPPVIRRSVRNEFPRRNSHLNSRCRSERRVFFSGPAILPESGLIAACNPPRSRKHRVV